LAGGERLMGFLTSARSVAFVCYVLRVGSRKLKDVYAGIILPVGDYKEVQQGTTVVTACRTLSCPRRHSLNVVLGHCDLSHGGGRSRACRQSQ
jgi:hypothetical protein